MTERRTPYLASECITVPRQEYERLHLRYRIALKVIQAMIDCEGRERCPCCGWRLKDNADNAALDNS